MWPWLNPYDTCDSVSTIEQQRKSATHEEGHVVAHHELHDIRQRAALGKVDEVLQAEGEVDVRVQLDPHALRQLVVLVLLCLLRRLLALLLVSVRREHGA